ncbi:MAG: DUF805 domain-containing protein [Tannerella sp.]|jgi:uncharacterized membrane protein YhaH (DUF805 family)|nr:DUF805 domain-containing protein [Tannerella sp.]
MNWFLNVLKHYADFSGRARRKEYWMFLLFSVIFSVVWYFVLSLLFIVVNVGASIDDLLIGGYMMSHVDIFGDGGAASSFLGANYTIQASYLTIMLLPGLAVAVRRLHDTGKSGLMLLVGLIPLAGAIWLLVLMLAEGQPDANKYGANPKTSPPEPFSDKKKLQSAGVTLMTASILTFLLNILISILLSIKYNISFGFNTAFIVLFSIMLLTVGILLLNEKTVYPVHGKVKYAFIILPVAFFVSLLGNIAGLVYNLSNVAAIGWKPAIGQAITLPGNFMLILFSAIVLFSGSNKKLIRQIAVWTVVFTVLRIMWQIYYAMGSTVSGNVMTMLWIYQIILPVAFIVLIATFYPSKSQIEKDVEH